ncbi:MAG: 3-methyl-2-oxobutanoate hydroxymethyltransferase [Nevskiales bacterium]
MSSQVDLKTLTLTDLRKMRSEGEKIACLTAYDASFAAAEDAAGVDLVLVGDSLGMVVQGLETTVPVSVDDIVYHTRATARGLDRAFLVADMPFMSYATRDRALDNAARLMQEGGAKMVKLEGGEIEADIVRYLTERGIPVCGHIGLQPQLVHKLGGFRVQGRETAAAEAMKQDAIALEQAGADLLLLECVPAELGAQITAAASVPVIGIGAGPDTDGQILVLYDILDITRGRKPRFVRNFMADADDIHAALSAYVAAVKGGSYPASEHLF